MNTEKIQLALSQIEESTNFEILAEMKAAMNSVYGDARNQIVKPTVEGIIEALRSSGSFPEYEVRIENETMTGVMDLLKSFTWSTNYQTIIHFPEIMITNGSMSHKINDIYVRFAIKPDGRIAPYIQGIRTTVTEAEYMSRYLHSHLHRLDPNRITFTNFCTGVGEINQVLALLNVKYTPANFMMFLMHIKNYLEWESKEGSPYILMESIARRGNGLRGIAKWWIDQCADLLIKTMASRLSIEECIRMLSFQVSEGGIEVSSTIELERWIKSIMVTWDPRGTFGARYEASAFLARRDSDGEYHSIEDSPVSLAGRLSSTVVLNFKGQEIKFQIIEKLEKKEDEILPNPKITEEVCKELSRLFSKTAITTPGIRTGSSFVHNLRASKSNNISV